MTTSQSTTLQYRKAVSICVQAGGRKAHVKYTDYALSVEFLRQRGRKPGLIDVFVFICVTIRRVGRQGKICPVSSILTFRYFIYAPQLVKTSLR